MRRTAKARRRLRGPAAGLLAAATLTAAIAGCSGGADDPAPPAGTPTPTSGGATAAPTSGAGAEPSPSATTSASPDPAAAPATTAPRTARPRPSSVVTLPVPSTTRPVPPKAPVVPPRRDGSGAAAVPQNPHRGPNPPPAPPRPVPEPEWTDARWKPGDPVDDRTGG